MSQLATVCTGSTTAESFASSPRIFRRKLFGSASSPRIPRRLASGSSSRPRQQHGLRWRTSRNAKASKPPWTYAFSDYQGSLLATNPSGGSRTWEQLRDGAVKLAALKVAQSGTTPERAAKQAFDELVGAQLRSSNQSGWSLFPVRMARRSTTRTRSACRRCGAERLRTRSPRML